MNALTSRSLRIFPVTRIFRRCCAALLIIVSPSAFAQPTTPITTSTPAASSPEADQSPTAPSAASPAPAYRRVFVPAERTAEWPTYGEQYLPIERGQFQRLVEEAEQRRQLGLAGGARITAAAVTARLTPNDLLEGIATFDVRLTDKSPAIVPLAPWNAVPLRASWRFEATEESDPPAALLGLWELNDERQPTYGLLADRDGQIEVDWQASPNRQGVDLDFTLHFPTALTQQLTLELPAAATPTISSAVLLEQPTARQGDARRWKFQLAGGIAHRLEIRRPVPDRLDRDATSSLPLAALTEAFHIKVDGVDYEAELRLQQRDLPAGELRLKIPAKLHIAAVGVNRSPAEWRRDPEDAAAILITIPATSTPATVVLAGAAATTLDAPWQLPSVTPQDVVWTEGTATLWVDPALELRSLTPRECSLLNVVGVGSGAAGEVYRLQSWSPAATAELLVGNRRASLHHRRLAAAEFADREIVASSRASVWATGGRVFQLAMPLAPDWIVESVEANAADAIAEWHVEESMPRQLHVALRHSPAESAPLELNVTARKPWRGWTRMATISDLDFLQFPGANLGSWLEVKDRHSGQIAPDAALAPSIISAEEVPPAQRTLLGEPSKPNLLIDLSRAAPGSMVSIVSTPTSYAAEGWMELTAVDAGFEQRIELLCRPAGGALTELRLLAARPFPPETVWEFDGGEPLLVEPVAPAPLPSATVPPAGPVEYRLSLGQPRTAPFRIRGAWRAVTPAAAAVNVVSLPDAQAWQAWAIFRARSGQFTVASGGATPCPAIPAAAETGETPVIACYRLGDDPLTPLANPPKFVPRAGEAASSVVAWRCDAHTLQLADGVQSHRIDYLLESRMPAEIRLTLPPRCSLASLTLDGRPLAGVASDDDGQIRFRLPGEPAPQTLGVTLERIEPPLGRRAAIEPAIPQTSFPVVQGEWTARWPASYDASSNGRFAPDPESSGVMTRLLGPLSGARGARWYDGMLLAHVDAASTVAPAGVDGPVSPGGWNSLAQSFVDQPTPIQLQLASGEQASWHVAWLIATVGAAWVWPRWRWLALLMAAVTAIVCLIVPESLTPLPQAIFLGIVAGSLTRQLVRFLTRQRGVERLSPPTLSAVRTLSLITLVASLLSLEASSALAQTTSPPTERNIPQQVLFPIDAEGNPVGDDVYVPAPMAAELLPDPAGQIDAALIDAHYQIELPAAEQATPPQASLRFRWESRRPGIQVELPLRRGDGPWEAGSFLLDGHPIIPRWNADGTALAIELPQSGPHELTAAVALPAAVAGQWASLKLHIPPLAGAKVGVLHAAGLVGVTATGAIPLPGESSALRTALQLGPAESLDLSWPVRVEQDATAVAVEQLSWLELDPATARLELRLRLSGDAAAVETLRLAVSPQLKLLPLPEGSPLELLAGDPDNTSADQLVEFRFQSPPILPATLSFQFQLQRSLSVGRIEYPGIDVLGMNVQSRHFAVSADKRLRIRDTALSGLTPVAAAELEPLWGPPVAAAALRYAVAAATPEWSLHVSPAPPRFVSRDSLQLHCGPDAVEVDYSAAIAEVDGEVLVHRLVVSPDLQIEQVVASVDGPDGAIPLRWSRPEPEKLHVFLGRPIAEPHLLRVTGRLNDVVIAAPPAGVAADAGIVAAIERRFQLPRIALESVPSAPLDLFLFRDSQSLVDWVSPPPPRASTSTVMSSKGLFVGQFTLSRVASPPPELRIFPNDAQFEADALLTFQHDSAKTIAEAQLHGSAAAGVVDAITLEVGKNWRGPFACEPAAQVVARPLAGEPDRQLLEVRLARPIPAGESFDLRIQGPLALEADQRIRLPAFRIANARKQQVYVILPPTAGNLTAEWTLRGLRSQPLPERLQAALKVEKAALAYRVDRNQFIAEQRVFPDAIRVPAYRLAETRVVVDDQGIPIVQSQLILQAGGGEDCRIELPDGAQLQYAAVDGAPQARLALSEGSWQVPARSRFLPRSVFLCYRLAPLDATAERLFEPPRVLIDGAPLSPQKSLWQIADPLASDSLASDSPSITQADFTAASRVAQIDAFLDAYPLASQLADWEWKLWRQPWLARLAATGGASSSDDPAAWKQVRQRLAADSENSRDLRPAVDPWSSFAVSAPCYLGDDQGNVVLQPRRAPQSLARWLVAVTLAAVVMAAWRRPPAFRAIALPVRRWPYAAVAAAGALWWLFLAPSLFGLLIIIFAVAAYAKSRK